MGLDMYLYLSKYESCGRWDKDYDEKKKGFYPVELGQFEIDKRNFMSKETRYQVGYWRKSNAIHKWFVENCANGEDNCRPVHVDVEKARELLDLVNKVLENHELAEKLLPTGAGFFFGSTDYGEWYFEDLEYTKDLLEKVIKFVEENEEDYYDIWYKASW